MGDCTRRALRTSSERRPFGSDHLGPPTGLQLTECNVLIGWLLGAEMTAAVRCVLPDCALDATVQQGVHELKVRDGCG